MRTQFHKGIDTGIEHGSNGGREADGLTDVSPPIEGIEVLYR